MRFTAAALVALSAVSGAFAWTATATYSTAYDVGNESLVGVACSNGDNGLMGKGLSSLSSPLSPTNRLTLPFYTGYTTFDSLPAFPYIGGAHVIEGWNSKNCGACFQLGYKNKTIIFQAVDSSPGNGFNLAKRAMNDLTNGEGVTAGSVQITYEQVDDKLCYDPSD
ncbi:hypothetical protein EIP91_010946 [Steccherinum ochraceum]|uniref:Uncharacterized protein n=1 Tax=Steccherinum ochraceum TaxID=92696 RepID=A0A4R0R8I5_9APHY|nr:hypothetical protein EIP91_010946 [Steccherinum ochraceum]